MNFLDWRCFKLPYSHIIIFVEFQLIFAVRKAVEEKRGKNEKNDNVILPSRPTMNQDESKEKMNLKNVIRQIELEWPLSE